MRVERLLLTENFPPRLGGSGRWLYELFSRFEPDRTLCLTDHHPHARSFDPHCPLAVERLDMHFPDWGLLGWRSWQRYRRLTAALRRIVRRHRPAWLYAGRVLPEAYIARRLARRGGPPYSLFVHGEELNAIGASRQLTAMARAAFADADLVIANSNNTAQMLAAAWPVRRERLAVLHPGIDTTAFRPAPHDPSARTALGWADRRVILTVGRLQRRKGHDRLIQAIDLLRADRPDLLLAIVGQGAELPRLQQAVAQSHLDHHVRFHGPLDPPALLQAYQQCDLFVLANRLDRGSFEGFGIVLLEAQAAGKPVVAGICGGTAETMQPGRTGLLVDADNPHALADALAGLLDEPDRRRAMGLAARRHVVEHFDWSVILPHARALLAIPPRPVPHATGRPGFAI